SGFGITAFYFQQVNEMRQVEAELRLKHYLINEQLTRRPDGEQMMPGSEFAEPEDALARELFGSPFDEPPQPEPGPQLMRRASIARAFASEQAPYYFTLWFRDGTVLERSPNAPLASKAPPYESNTQFRNTGSGFEVYGFTPPGECILVGISNTSVQAAMRAFTWKIVAVCGGVLALGLLGGWWVAARAIAPIRDISATAMRIAQGDLNQRIRVSNTDTELGQLTALLNDTFTRLAASFEEQKRFTSDAAHELRTPISVILAQTQLALSKERTNEANVKTIEMTRRSAERMQNLIESLLTLAKADAGAKEAREPVQLDALTRENLDEIRPLAEQRQITLHGDFSPAACQAHPSHVTQILTNLLANAVKYCRPGDHVHISTHRHNGHAILKVADTGPGIAAEHLPYLFDRFYRADASRNRSTGGAGLGLAICKTLAEAHGGHLRVESVLEQGTTFELTLPALN
ncbi:MAG: HAMP domain-containing sensor histidine kinase, partial [Verrucomicrobia bacterium]|nr:HAMP domain-containing sensor histidine kinase [Verrucomicrobiota bacterium]